MVASKAFSLLLKLELPWRALTASHVLIALGYFQVAQNLPASHFALLSVLCRRGLNFLTAAQWVLGTTLQESLGLVFQT
jgi:hypothetical protein